MENPDAPYFGLAQPPSTNDLREVAAAAKGCRACHLWRHATQTIFGEGLPKARVMLVGEQPGDQEDKQGRPFVGPAGRVLSSALEEAGIDPGITYTTNAVKHFKWEARGNRRLHKRPVYREVQACYPWLEVEIELVDPELIVCLGSTAAQALLGKDFKVTQHRGAILPGPHGKLCFVTVHPSSILRAVDDETRKADRAKFVADLKSVAAHLAKSIRGRASVR
jgi:uracil-DNA glycosylase family protein